MIGKITIQNTDYSLRYGMSIARAFAKYELDNVEQEDFVSKLIYEAHVCYAKSMQIATSLTFFDCVEYVEGAICSKDETELAAIAKVVNDYSESQFTKDLIKSGKAIVEEKKSLSLQIMSDSHTEN